MVIDRMDLVPSADTQLLENLNLIKTEWEEESHPQNLLLPYDNLIKKESLWKEKEEEEENYIILRDIPYETAKQEIMHFLESHSGEIFISDIIMNLKIDLETVLAVLDELHQEGLFEWTD